MAKFTTPLQVEDITDTVWRVISPLIYESDLLKCTVTVPIGFQTDLASVPRLPIIYMLWGARSHHEAVLHDWAYRIDSGVSFDDANNLFLEAMEVRGKSWFVRKFMYWGVCMGGFSSYHKKKVEDKLC